MKEYWEDKDKRRGLIGTILVHAILLLVFIFMGLKYYEPKPEEGIVINFGNSATGIGDQADGAPQPQVKQQQQEQQAEPVETPAEEPTATESPTMIQDVVDAPAVEKKEEKAKPKPKEEKPEEKKPTPEELEQQRLEREREEKRRQLEEKFGKVSDAKAGGEGVKEGPGDQGDPNGDPNSDNRTGGSGGGGGGGNYLLGNRQALSKPQPTYNCPDQGRVVVKIYVDRNGKVTRAVPGERVPKGAASTTASSCLYERAKQAAMRTTWQADSEAPTLQIGYIIYNFTKN